MAAEPPRMLSDQTLQRFRQYLARAKTVCVLTGAGVSAESGVPTFRGEGGLWRRFPAEELSNPRTLERNPSLLWEFFHYRRTVVSKCSPNAGHLALTAAQKKLRAANKDLTLITQNIDGLHIAAGMTAGSDVIEMHGALRKLRCTKCGVVTENNDLATPLVPAFSGRGAPDDVNAVPIPPGELPHCPCGGMLRPHVVFFRESLDSDVMEEIYGRLDECELFIVAGTSAVVYPAAAFAPRCAERGIPVVEINMEETPVSGRCTMTILAPSGQVLPKLLDVEDEVNALLAERAAAAAAASQ